MEAWEPLPFPPEQAGERLGPRPLESIVYASPVVSIGAFRALPSQAGFRDSGPIERHIFVFPRTTVSIRHEGSEGFVADPNNVCFYNRGQVYTRTSMAGEGDRSDWFAVRPDLLADAIVACSCVHDVDPERPFPFQRGACDRRSHALARLVVRHLVESPGPDALFVDEATAELLERLLARAGPASEPRAPARRAHTELVDAIKGLLAETFAESFSLADLARRLGVSVFHVSRVFHAVTGQTLHAYRGQLRLRASLDRVAAGLDLTDVALDLGYSSHSHFTSAFSRSFGVSPSLWRRTASGAQAAALATRLAG